MPRPTRYRHRPPSLPRMIAAYGLGIICALIFLGATIILDGGA